MGSGILKQFSFIILLRTALRYGEWIDWCKVGQVRGRVDHISVLRNLASNNMNPVIERPLWGGVFDFPPLTLSRDFMETPDKYMFSESWDQALQPTYHFFRVTATLGRSTATDKSKLILFPCTSSYYFGWGKTRQYLPATVSRARVGEFRKNRYVCSRGTSELSENIYLSGVSKKSRETACGGKSKPPLIMFSQ